MCQKFLSDPQKPPYRQKFLPQSVKNRSKFRVKFASKVHKKWNGDENIYPRVLKHYLGPNSTIPKILRSAEISTLLGIFLTFCSWATFFFKNLKFSNLLNFQPNIWISVRGKYVLGTYPFFQMKKNFGSEISTATRNFYWKLIF